MNKIIDGLMNEHNRIGTTIIILMVVAILGGIASMFFLGSAAALTFIVGGTLLTEVVVLSGQPMKRIIYVGFIATLINVGFIIGGALA